MGWKDWKELKRMKQDVRQQALNELVDQWQHCLRCSLADMRCSYDKAEGKFPAPVAFVSDGEDRGWNPRKLPPQAPLLIMYSCPDPEQFLAGNLGAIEDASEETGSRSQMLVEECWRMVRNLLPWDLDEVAFSFALGCRPVNFKDPRKTTKPKQQWLKACRRRWQTEVSIVDPDLVLLCGRHALATVRPDLTTKYTKLLGEIVDFRIPGERGTVLYSGYVGPSPEDVFMNTPDEKFTADLWDMKPASRPSDDPFHDWLWHMVFSSWLAHSLMCRRKGLGLPHESQWPALVGGLKEFYGEITPTSVIVRRVEAEVEFETYGVGARAAQTEAGDDDDGDEDDEDDG